MDSICILGRTEIGFYEYYPEVSENIIFLNVHQDETTSIESLHHYTKVDSFSFFYLLHSETRRITFELKGKNYDFDPNRIFTRRGIRKTLKDGERKSRKAIREVEKLSNAILSRLPANHTVIAVHNNTDINYSIKSYLPGGGEFKNTKLVYVNDEMDPDDFIYTTDFDFYEAFKSKGINVILQDNNKFVNDGSLSVYCGLNDIPYINIETQKGHFDEQIMLIKMVLEVLRGK